VQIYGLIGLKPPGNAKAPGQVQVECERAWRSKVGDARFEEIIDLIVEMAGDAFD
jgi:hypothetical protein